jgi:hypothetical protein
VLLVVVQEPGPAPAGFVRQGPRVALSLVDADPVINTLAGYAEHAGQVGDRVAAVHLQQRQRPPEDADIARPDQLASECSTLRRGQVKPAHRLLLSSRASSRAGVVSN